MDSLFNVLLPVLSGGLSTLLMTGLKKLITVIGTLPAIAQQVLVSTISWGVVKISLFLTVSLTSVDVTQLAATDTLALASAGLAFLFHMAKKQA